MRQPSRGQSTKSTWRHEKSSKPDVGSYEAANANMKQSIRKNTPTCTFSKVVSDRYTTAYAKSKAFVPGVGNYDTDKCIKRLSRPPSATRRRR